MGPGGSGKDNKGFRTRRNHLKSMNGSKRAGTIKMESILRGKNGEKEMLGDADLSFG